MRSALQVAGELRTGVPVGDLHDLMPAEGPQGAEIASWIALHPEVGAVADGVAFSPGTAASGSTEERRLRAVRYLEQARDMLAGSLERSRPLLLCLAVTGSTAYGEPEAEDDCDFFAVTRRGTVWPFLAFAFLALRMRRTPGSREPTWCFNYVLDEPEVAAEYARPQGFLFAREALMCRPLHGEEFYRGLLGSAPWLRTEAPRLYARWEGSGLPPFPRSAPAPAGLRLLNWLLFPVVGMFLQLKGLRHNHRLRREGREAECFRTVTRPGRLALVTERFERLSRLYAPASIVPVGRSEG